MNAERMELRRATPEEMRFVYRRDFETSFPPMELRTLEEIENLIRRGKYEFLCLWDGAEIVGEIALCRWRPGWMFWDYLCVTPSRRNDGLGAYMSRKVSERYGDDVIFWEAEAPEHSDAPELAKRRLDFYLRLGATLAGFEAELFGVYYRIAYWSNVPLFDADILREYDGFCRDVFTPDEYARYVHIPSNPETANVRSDYENTVF